MTSDRGEADAEEDEFRAAAQHLTQDFLCQVLQEEGGRGLRPDDCQQQAGPEEGAGPDEGAWPDEGAGPQRQVAPLAAILGKLPSGVDLVLPQDGDESVTGEWHLGGGAKRGGAKGGGASDDDDVCAGFTEEQAEGGELDLDGIDDQEIDKVGSSTDGGTSPPVEPPPQYTPPQ